MSSLWALQKQEQHWKFAVLCRMVFFSNSNPNSAGQCPRSPCFESWLRSCSRTQTWKRRGGKAQPGGDHVFYSIRIHLRYLTVFNIKAVFNDHIYVVVKYLCLPDGFLCYEIGAYFECCAHLLYPYVYYYVCKIVLIKTNIAHGITSLCTYYSMWERWVLLNNWEVVKRFWRISIRKEGGIWNTVQASRVFLAAGKRLSFFYQSRYSFFNFFFYSQENTLGNESFFSPPLSCELKNELCLLHRRRPSQIFLNFYKKHHPWNFRWNLRSGRSL